jgi:hypothetical protein
MGEAPSKIAKKTYINGYRCSNIRCPDPMYLFDCQHCGKETNVRDSCPNCHRPLSSEKKPPQRGPRIMGYRSVYRCTTCPWPMYSFDCPHCGKIPVWTHCPYCGLIAPGVPKPDGSPMPQAPGVPKPDAAPMPQAPGVTKPDPPLRLPQAPGGPKPDAAAPMPQAPGGPKPDAAPMPQAPGFMSWIDIPEPQGHTVDNSNGDGCDEGDERDECDNCLAEEDNPGNPCPYHTDYMQADYSPPDFT